MKKSGYYMILAAVVAAAVIAYFSTPTSILRPERPQTMVSSDPGDEATDETRTDHNYLMATATLGGTYYPVGVAISTLVRVKLLEEDGIAMSAINSAGSGENIRLLLSGEVQFAILQGLFGYNAWNGLGDVDQVETRANIRSISMLWRNVEQFVCRADRLGAGTLTDIAALTGEKMAFGRRNSGTIESNRVIVASLGIDMDRVFELFDAGYGPSAEALQNGQVACMSTPAGVPTGAVTAALAARGDDAAILTVTAAELEAADAGRSLWTRFDIAAETYPGQAATVATMAQPNFLAVRADVDEDHVYKVTKTIYENLEFLLNIHAATEAMSLEAAIVGVPVPLHPGALRYYREVGIEVPDALLAE
ncbi:MAG: TAXI family TRAP transporter solute-binding subunit [Alphaproteobacteria bacterium]|nr:TAXI family TRAP transporter solute-binding subunit [Alphaproteobacteria bacterium]